MNSSNCTRKIHSVLVLNVVAQSDSFRGHPRPILSTSSQSAASCARGQHPLVILDFVERVDGNRVLQPCF